MTAAEVHRTVGTIAAVEGVHMLVAVGALHKTVAVEAHTTAVHEAGHKIVVA